MTALKTQFAPAERADKESISRDAQCIASEGLLLHVTNAVPCIVLILNRQRQVVYKNQRLMDFLGETSDLEVLGKRPGELLDCIHAYELPTGCGTTEFCRECGAVNAILQSQNERVQSVKECRITTNSGVAYEFRVWATPYIFAGKNFTVFSVIDLADEKRRQSLERTFFHDINNNLTVISALLELFPDFSKSQEQPLKPLEVLKITVDELFEEIASHRRLLQAENGQLSVNISTLSSLSLLKELATVYARNECWPEQNIVVPEDSEEVVITSDRALLLRVLGNMLKNALEASSGAKSVTLSCKKNGSSAVFSVHNPGRMPRSTQLQLFQRSFSTKGIGRGIGTYSMKLFGEGYLKGKVWFSTSEEEGTLFHISVPIMFPKKQQSHLVDSTHNA